MMYKGNWGRENEKVGWGQVLQGLECHANLNAMLNSSSVQLGSDHLDC